MNESIYNNFPSIWNLHFSFFFLFSRAGLREGDVIVAINGKAATESADVYKAIESGKPLTLNICRRHQTFQVVVQPEVVS